MTLYTDTGLAIYDEITKAKVRYISRTACLPHLGQFVELLFHRHITLLKQRKRSYRIMAMKS